MKPVPKPHPTQVDPIRHPADRLFIEAGPGTGKTFVVAERFGHLAFRRGAAETRVLALSFTVSATSVLRRALLARWGRQAVEFPHRVQTFDSIFREVLEFLLRSGLVKWPGNHVTLEPLDEWEDRQPAPAIAPVSWEPILDGQTVTADKCFVDPGELVVTAKKRLMPQLEAGLCTHDAIRNIVIVAAADPTNRECVKDFLRGQATSVLVDELFDANSSDIELLCLLLEAGCAMTVVGDPWQALYDFRHSAPADVESELLAPHGFTPAPLQVSFRFAENSEAERVAIQARSTNPCDPLIAVTEPEAVLAAEWKDLWGAGPEVLPMAFGQVRSQLDALMALLLDEVVRAYGFSGSRFKSVAAHKLGIDISELGDRVAVAVEPVIALLSSAGALDVEAALHQLSLVPKEHFDASKKVTVSADAKERYKSLLVALADRLRHAGRHVPGLTVHQAKGNEWDRVAVIVAPSDIAALTAGLDVGKSDHRRLYVALTRGRVESGKYA